MTNNVVGKKMVAGFLFAGNLVFLVQKLKPEWQKDLLNGVGGVIEGHETPIQAMYREFKEETGYKGLIEWRHFATEVEPFGAYVYFFTASLGIEGNIDGIQWPEKNDIGEPLYWVSTRSPRQMLGNLNWLIPLAKDWRNPKVLVEVSGDIRERATW